VRNVVKTDADPYRTVNFILLVFILCLFAYSAIYSPEGGHYPISSNQHFFGNGTTLSTGLSRGFSSIMRGQFKQAEKYNPHSLRIFGFFFLQGLLRLFFIFQSYLATSYVKRRVILTDGVISSLMFLILFSPFLIDLFRFR
jgi:hypothetical protein